MIVCSLRSKSLETLNNPFVQHNEASAIYNIRNLVNLGKDIALVENLDDLELVEIGTFDSKRGLTRTKMRVIIPVIKIPGLKTKDELRARCYDDKEVEHDIQDTLSD